MPGSRRAARFNRAITNRILGPISPWMPGFGVIHHTGRSSGRRYHTPIFIFRRAGGYVVVLTFGPGADWVKNVLAAGQCDVETRSHLVHLVEPRVYVDQRLAAVPAPIRIPLRLTGVREFLALDLPTDGA